METRNCKNCLQSFSITDEDIVYYARIQVPYPTWCPTCRRRRRYGHINDYVFYTRPCDYCKKDFVSVFPPNSEYIVYCHDCWYADTRGDKAQAKDYDPNRSFFQQFDELMHTVPQLGIIGMNNLNSNYCESVANCKNCYLISESSNCEDCMYCYWIQKTKDCLDSSYTHECENCYEITDCFNCYNLKYSQNCSQCSDSYFLNDCSSCEHCLFCTNLKHKKYHIFNQPITEEKYKEELSKIESGEYTYIQELKKIFQEFLQKQPRKNLQIQNVQNSDGDYVRNTKNCRHVFHCYDAEDCAYGEHIWRGAKDCYDANTAGRNAELIYESTNSGIDSYNIKFSRYCWSSNNLEYCNECKVCKNLFGCVGLKPGSEYCILNKQYSKEEYENLVKQIKENMKKDGEYGEFFPLSISAFGYNNSVSFDEMPLTKEQIEKNGWKWENQKSGTYNQGNRSMNNIQNINTVDESICNDILTCNKCNKNYKVIKQEYNFYKKNTIPIPLKCPDCRHRERLGIRNKKHFTDIQCSKCQKDIKTTLDTDKFKNIVCQSCYENLIY